MDGWIKMFVIDGDEKVAAVRYVNRRNIVTIDQEGGRIAAVMSNGDTVGMPEMPPDESKLPYDAEVEYLESTGAQYIDTGFVPNGNLSMSVRYMVRAMTAANNVAIYGCVVSGGGFFSGVAYDQMFRRYFYFVNNTATGVDLDFALNTVYDDALSGTTYTHNAQSSIVTAQTAGTRTIPLFARRNNSEVIERIGTTRIYSFTLVSGGAIVRDFIPVRVGSGSSAVGYLYDRANPTGGPLGNGLYGNAADGQGGVTGFPANCIGPDK